MKNLEQTKPRHRHSTLIDALGGPASVKAIFPPSKRTGRVLTDSSISEWRYSGIPSLRLELIKASKPKVFKSWLVAATAPTHERRHV
jgi:hypothetical protein